MRSSTILLLLALITSPLTAATFTRNAPVTTNNDDTCDISLLPAATLLLPYFEVSPVQGEQTTIVTVTNTGALPQAARVTLWTDFGYPVISFSVYLTGYDVQSLDLHDVIFRGRIAPDAGTGSDRSAVGELSRRNPTTPFDNPQLVESSCAQLVVQLPSAFMVRMGEAFRLGRFPALGSIPACAEIGGVHGNAVGYATIDVTTVCSNSLPIDPEYFAAELGYDNVLMGDYVQVDGANDYAQASPMVHIRAIPEGGNPRTTRPTNFTRTFYSHLQTAGRRTLDARQPLPSVFAARWIQGTESGFDTHYKIWREVDTPPNAECSDYTNNAFTRVAEVVRFDEEENPETALSVPIFQPVVEGPALAATERIGFDRGDVLPPNSTNAPGGWVYFNLDSGEHGDAASQNWVVVSMRAAGRYSADMDALALGNGCSAPAGRSNANVPRGPQIGPAPNVTP